LASRHGLQADPGQANDSQEEGTVTYMEDHVQGPVCHCGRNTSHRGHLNPRHRRNGPDDKRFLCTACAREADRTLGRVVRYAGSGEFLEAVKLVFLDFDGVMASSQYAAEHHEEVLEPAKAALLNDLIARTDALIVVSSSWRSSVGQMRDWLARAGLLDAAHRVLSITPRVEPNYWDENRSQRAVEISRWLENWGFDRRDTRFCILDDGDEMGDLTPYLVQIDPFFGLTHRDTALAAQLLCPA
jgi:hypothetical protein